METQHIRLKLGNMFDSSFWHLSILVCMIWLQAMSGTNMNFAAYSSELKHVLNTSQWQLSLLVFASDLGKLFGFVPAFILHYLPQWVVLLIGSILGFIGYGIQYFLITRSSLSYPQAFVLTVLAGNSISWINTVCYHLAMKDVSFHHRFTVGLSACYQVLSADVFTVLAGAIFPLHTSRVEAFLVLNSLLPFLVSLVCAPIIGLGVRNIVETIMNAWFTLLLILAVVTGISATLVSILSRSYPLVSAIVILGFLLAPLLVPIVVQYISCVGNQVVSNDQSSTVDVENNNINAVVVDERNEKGEKVGDVHDPGSGNKNGANKGGDDNNPTRVEAANEDIGAKLIFKRWNFWLYSFVYLFGPALGLVYINNLGQIAESRGYSKISSLVSLSSCCGFFGRLVPPLVHYFIPSWITRRIPNPLSVAVLMILMAGAFLLLLDPSSISLHISTAVIAFCTGAITTISMSMTAELFGKKNFSVNHNIVVANIPIGSFMFGYIAAHFYHKGAGHEDGKCIGTECYKNTFIIWSSLCFFGILLALILYALLRNFYARRTEIRNTAT